MVAGNRDDRGLLQQDYSVSLSSGIGDVQNATGSVTSAADILFEAIPQGVVRDADGNRLNYIPNRQDFEGWLDPAFKYYCLSDRVIYVRSATSNVYASDLGDINGPLTITASFVLKPSTIAYLPANLEDDIVKQMAEVLSRKLPVAK